MKGRDKNRYGAPVPGTHPNRVRQYLSSEDVDRLFKEVVENVTPPSDKELEELYKQKFDEMSHLTPEQMHEIYKLMDTPKRERIAATYGAGPRKLKEIAAEGMKLVEQQSSHQHKEAFCLMWYACVGDGQPHPTYGYQQVARVGCGHRERYWNSRDGVTPFGTLCPSCGRTTLQHVDFWDDTHAPDHKPHRGQRVWRDMRAEDMDVEDIVKDFAELGVEEIEARARAKKMIDDYVEKRQPWLESTP